jgi:hypothetical protein
MSLSSVIVFQIDVDGIAIDPTEYNAPVPAGHGARKRSILFPIVMPPSAGSSHAAHFWSALNVIFMTDFTF